VANRGAGRGDREPYARRAAHEAALERAAYVVGIARMTGQSTAAVREMTLAEVIAWGDMIRADNAAARLAAARRR
jgi:hypothetical protein